MKNANKIMLAGAVALGLTAIANTEASADTYTVRPGDTVWDLAQAHNVSISDIDAVNPNINVDTHLIIVGDTINLPDGITVTLPSETTNTVAEQPVVANEQPAVEQPQVVNQVQQQVQVQESGSVHDQFISAGGTEAMWSAIVLPESGGDVNASNGQYHGLGQTNQSWGYGSVAEQTQGMLQYAQERYNGIDEAIAFRESHNFW
jgi:hypothetical protein